MITIANPEKYVAGLYERLSNENIEVGNGEVIVTMKMSKKVEVSVHKNYF